MVRGMTYVPRAGDIFLTRIGGWTGGLFTLGQMVALTPSRYSHAGVFLGPDYLIAAQPGGARIDPVSTVMDDRPLAILQVPEWAQDRRESIALTALGFEGLPYGYEDYALMALSRLHIRPDWVTDRLADPARLSCGALADRIWELNGLHLFRDGRPLGAVTPGHLSTRGTTHHIGTGPYPTAS